MKRDNERKIIFIVSFWHFINALLTILFFGVHLKRNGTDILSQMYPELGGVNSSLVDIVFIVISTYGLALIVIAFLNIYFLKRMEDNVISRKWQVWLGVMLFVSFITMDVISVLLYLISLVIYNSKNKAIRIGNKETAYSDDLLKQGYS